jgi:glycosyltransferase involved in cell wall biosynthesis
VVVKYQILIPVKNGMPYLAESIYSVLRSKNLEEIKLEIHISDAGSSDDSIDFLKTLTQYNNIFLHFNQDLSREENWNYISRFTDGDFVRLLCADDRVADDSIARSINIFKSNNDIDIITGRRKIINSEGKVIFKDYGKSKLPEMQKLSGSQVFKKIITSGTNILGEPSNVTFRTSAFLDSLPWSEKFSYCLDLSFYSNVLQNHNVWIDSQVHSEFRVHRESFSHTLAFSQSRDFIKFIFNQLDTKKLEISKLDKVRLFSKAILRNLLRLVFYFIFIKQNRLSSGKVIN